MKTSLIVHFFIAGFGTRKDQASKLSSWVRRDAGLTSFGALSLSSSLLRSQIGLCGCLTWSGSYWRISTDFTKDFYFQERTRLLPNCLRSTLRIWFPWRCHRHLKNWNLTSEKSCYTSPIDFLCKDMLQIVVQVVHFIILHCISVHLTLQRGGVIKARR